jgi:hypothetical protein
LSTQKKTSEFDIQAALQEVCTANDVKSAFDLFKSNLQLLEDWRIVYACQDMRGAFKVPRLEFGNSGVISSALGGKSLIVLDKEFINSKGPIRYEIGHGLYADSNVASYFRGLSYYSSTTDNLKAYENNLRKAIGIDGLQRLNPFYYIWECQRNWNEKTREACVETVAAILAFHMDSDPLGPGWNDRFMNLYRETCERQAVNMINELLTEALSEETINRLALIEAMILRTKLIDLESKKSAPHKLEQLIKFMYEELQVVMARELVICAEILYRGKTSLTKKLNSFERSEHAADIVRNAAWDIFMLRIMDAMVTPRGLPRGEVYLPVLISTDKDVRDLIKLTELKAIAVCRISGRTFPFIDLDLFKWLNTRLGAKRLENLAPLFGQEGFETRAKGRNLRAVKEILAADKVRLREYKK